MAQATEPFILILEDDPEQSALIQAAFTQSLAHAKLHFVHSSWEARAYLARESPYQDWEPCPTPSLIVLDLGQSNVGVIETLRHYLEQGMSKAAIARELGVERRTSGGSTSGNG